MYAYSSYGMINYLTFFSHLYTYAPNTQKIIQHIIGQTPSMAG